MTKNLSRRYENRIDDLSREIDERYCDYLKDKPRTVVIENLVFDVESLDQYFRCEGCQKRKPAAFCCSGHDLELTDTDRGALDKVMPKVLAMFPALKNILGQGGYWRRDQEFAPLMRQKRGGNCVFLIPGGKGCYLHAYALARGIDPIDVKPYICSLYPLAVIIAGDQVVVTTVNRESARVLDCGARFDGCIQVKGKPEERVIIRSRAMIERMFGKKVYQRVRRAAEKSRG